MHLRDNNTTKLFQQKICQLCKHFFPQCGVMESVEKKSSHLLTEHDEEMKIGK